MGAIRTREASAEDLRAVVALDPLRGGRAALLERRLADQRLLVADAAGEIVGYAAMGMFFEYDFLGLLFVRPQSRRKGVGTALIGAVEARSRTPKLFTSTNQSNTAMQALCDSLGFEACGMVEGLDEGDPELFYLKRLGGLAADRSPATPAAPRRSRAGLPGGRPRRSPRSAPG